MLVETFECTETVAEPIEATEEAMGLIDELGLVGQRELCTVSERNGRDTRCPYREMTSDEFFVYQVLCPKVYKLKEYKRSPIPLRVLQIAAHAKSLNIFNEIVVWDVAEAVVKDPVLIGIKKDPSSTRANLNFILARWGEVLESLPTLVNQALAKKRAEFRDSIRSAHSETAADLTRLEGVSDADLMKAGANANYTVSKPWGLFSK